jgi:hypothetical protein
MAMVAHASEARTSHAAVTLQEVESLAHGPAT